MILKTIEFGDSGLLVYVLQSILKYRGYLTANHVTSYFGMATYTALRAFREQHYLSGDSVCDAACWIELFRD